MHLFNPRPTQTPDEQRQTFESLLMDRVSEYAPLFDAADGMKADLLRRGWSDDVADYLAATWLAGMMAKLVQV